MKRGNLIGRIALSAAVLFLCSCERSEEEPGEGILAFSLKVENPVTRGVVMQVPDTNLFVLSVKRSGGEIIYEGKYGERPKDMKLTAGSYDVKVSSGNFVKPEFDLPVWEDLRTVVVKDQELTSLNLLCKQINAGLRLLFTDSFRSRFAAYSLSLKSEKGELAYSYGEKRFAYFFPGQIELVLISGNSALAPVPVTLKSLAARDMMTLTLDANSGPAPVPGKGIVVDTVANWLADTYVYGTDGDGSSRDKAISIERISSYSGEKGLWFLGYIVGGDITVKEFKWESPFVKESHIAVSHTPTMKVRSGIVPVALSVAKIKDSVNLVKNPGFLGRKIWIKGNVSDSYFGSVGLNPISKVYIPE